MPPDWATIVVRRVRVGRGEGRGRCFTGAEVLANGCDIPRGSSPAITQTQTTETDDDCASDRDRPGYDDHRPPRDDD
jgi:hypothetical protein